MRRCSIVLMTALSGLAAASIPAASAETITQALVSAYRANPEINSARASTRATDENVPIALSGLRPVVAAVGTLTGQTTDTPIGPSPRHTTLDGTVGLQVTQNIFQGFRVRNAILGSESGVLASRELLRNTVQNVLFDAAQAYMNVVRDSQILDIRHSNVLFLEEQVRAAQERFNVGENTRTDVAQARASLASARANVSLAGSTLATSRAIYHQVIGHDPDGLVGAFPYSKYVPAHLAQALIVGQNGHPAILAAIHQADVQGFTVKQNEGQLLPTVSLVGTIQHAESFNSSIDPNSASITGQVSVPLYSGGLYDAQVRQAKETYGQLKIQIDLFRDQVRAAVVTAWAQADAARGAISAAIEGVQAAEIALSGVQEEQRVGQRTTLDVLNAQQTLLSARETLILAQRDQIVAGFSLLSAMGRLTAEDLRLPTDTYDPTAHYQAVRNKWRGLRTPDGR